MADDGLDFGGWIKPPEVPPDPVGDEWRGEPGPPGPPGPAAVPSDAVPLMDGTGAAGAAGTAARGDHRHPSDTSRLALSGGTVTGVLTASAAGTGLAVTNNATVGGTLGVSGAATAGTLTSTGNVNVANGSNLYLVPGVVGLKWDGASSIVASHPFAASAINAGQALAISPSAAAIRPALFGSVGQLSGTITGQSDVFRLAVAADNTAGAGTGPADGIIKTVGIYHNVNGAAVSNGRAALWTQLNVLNGPTTTGLEMIGGSFSVFCSNTTGSVAPFCQPLVSAGGVAAGATAGNFINEFDYYAYAGASVGVKGGLLIALSTGDKVRGGIDAGLFFSNANTQTDGSPGMQSVIAIGNTNQGFPPSTADGAILRVNVQTAYKGSGRSVQMIPTQTQDGINLLPVYFTGSAFASAGFNVDGSGQLRSGNALISLTPTGVALDIDRQVVTAIAVAVGGIGTGAGTNDFYVGDTVTDAYGGIYTVATVTAGKIVTLTIRAPGTVASPPANPVPLSGGSGAGATVNLTWTVRNTLTLNPSAGPISGVGHVTLNSGVAFNNQVGATADDLSRHIDLFSGTFGFNVTSSRLNYVMGSGAHFFRVGGADVFSIGSGQTNVGNPAGQGTLNIVGATSTYRNLAYYTGTTAAAGLRWFIRANGVAEGGSNAGSDLEFVGYTDTGGGIGAALTITRANLTVTVGTDLRVSSNSWLHQVGFNGTAPVAKPTVTGAKGSNAALASLMTALAAYGLVTDTTTA